MFRELKGGGSRSPYRVSAKERKTLKIRNFFCGVGQFEDFRFSRRVLEPNRGGKRRVTVI